MGVDIVSQLMGLAASLLLGAALAILYDGLRALRLHRSTRRSLTALLDALYCVLLAAALSAFTLRVGEGELRLYMLLAVLAGAVVSFSLFSPLLRPLLNFWADSLFAFVQILRTPFLLAKKYYGKLHKLAKKLFLFFRSSLIIENYKWFARRSRRAAVRKEGASHGKRENRTAQKRRQSPRRISSARSHTAHR